MISANELRIGNLIRLGEGMIVKVQSIHPAEIKVHMKDEYIDAQFAETEPEQLYPIPLTEELLVKCGFERRNYSIETRNDYWFHVLLSEKIIYYLPYKSLSYYIGDITIEYLHQLQNLYYALVGNEINIQL